MPADVPEHGWPPLEGKTSGLLDFSESVKLSADDVRKFISDLRQNGLDLEGTIGNEPLKLHVSFL
jgi:hypothetical protein